MKKKSYELTRIYTDGLEEKPEIVPVNEIPWETKATRRGFLGVGVTMSAALMLMNASDLSSKNHVVSAKPDCDDVLAHEKAIRTLAISSDGKMLASGGEDNKIKLWSLPMGALMKTRYAHSDTVNALAIHPDGKLLASGSDDKIIKLWSLPDLEFIMDLGENNGKIHQLSFTPDGRRLISASLDKTIKVWSIPEGLLIDDLEAPAGILSLAISPDGGSVAVGLDDKSIRIWSFPEFELLQTLKGHSGNVSKLAYSQDGRFLISGCLDGDINLWGESDSGNIAKQTGAVSSMAVNSEEDVIISGNSSYGVHLRNLSDGKERKTIKKAHSGDIYSIAISPSDKFFATTGKDKSIKLWDITTGSVITCLMDLACNKASKKGVTVNGVNEYGQVITYTLPCGSPIPSGFTCTCNCVPGSIPLPAPKTSTRSSGSCSCNRVCTCVPVYR